MERVTDHQFALIDGKMRHVPGGVDEYLRLLDARDRARAESAAEKPQTARRERAEQQRVRRVRERAQRRDAPVLSRAEEYQLKKEIASTERKLDTLAKKAEAARAELAQADPATTRRCWSAQARVSEIEQQIADLEDVWVELSDRLLNDPTLVGQGRSRPTASLGFGREACAADRVPAGSPRLNERKPRNSCGAFWALRVSGAERPHGPATV